MICNQLEMKEQLPSLSTGINYQFQNDQIAMINQNINSAFHQVVQNGNEMNQTKVNEKNQTKENETKVNEIIKNGEQIADEI